MHQHNSAMLCLSGHGLRVCQDLERQCPFASDARHQEACKHYHPSKSSPHPSKIKIKITYFVSQKLAHTLGWKTATRNIVLCRWSDLCSTPQGPRQTPHGYTHQRGCLLPQGLQRSTRPWPAYSWSQSPGWSWLGAVDQSLSQPTHHCRAPHGEFCLTAASGGQALLWHMSQDDVLCMSAQRLVHSEHPRCSRVLQGPTLSHFENQFACEEELHACW